MIARIAAIIFIYICTTIAWMILGATIHHRSTTADGSLRGQVATTWGSPQSQHAPAATYTVERKVAVAAIENNKPVTREQTVADVYTIPLESSDIQSAIDLDHRRKGLHWFSTYKVAFDGTYQFRNNASKEVDVRFTLPYPATQAIFDDVQVTMNGQAVAFENDKSGAMVAKSMKPGETAKVRWSYKSQGLDQWNYAFSTAEVSQVKDFKLAMKTNFRDIDFAENTLSPTEKRPLANGWDLSWNYKNLVSGFQISMVLPQKLQPGPLAGQISLFAPVSLFFFFFVMLVITTLKNIELHPMNYFFLAGAFFAFHLLMAYLVDLIDINAAFLISSIVSVFLVISYLRLVVGLRFAAVEAGGAQLLYLVLFSYAFFFKGMTGLAVTIGSILTLFVVMQLTGRINWNERFAKASPPSLPLGAEGR